MRSTWRRVSAEGEEKEGGVGGGGGGVAAAEDKTLREIRE